MHVFYSSFFRKSPTPSKNRACDQFWTGKSQVGPGIWTRLARTDCHCSSTWATAAAPIVGPFVVPVGLRTRPTGAPLQCYIHESTLPTLAVWAHAERILLPSSVTAVSNPRRSTHAPGRLEMMHLPHASIISNQCLDVNPDNQALGVPRWSLSQARSWTKVS